MSRGILARQPGDKFINDNNEEMILEKFEAFPKFGKFDTKQQATQKLESVLSGHVYEVVNQPLNAFVILYFRYNKGTRIIVRYFKQITSGIPVAPYISSQFKNDTGFRIDNHIGESEHLPKPSEILSSKHHTYSEIKNVIGKTKDYPSIFRKMLKQVENGDITHVEGALKERAFVDKYLGEIAAPIALLTGNLVSGDYDILKDKLSKDAKIMFPSSVSHNLYDSTIQTKDTTINISSKSRVGRGAAASVGPIFQHFGKELKKKFPEEHAVLKTIAANSSMEGPLLLSKKIGLITQSQYEQLIAKMRSEVADTWDELDDDLKEKSFSYYQRSAKTHPGFRGSYCAISALGQLASKHVNEEYKIDYVVKSILTDLNVIQVYSKTSVQGDALCFSDFEVVVPKNYKGQIVLDSSKSLNSTQKPRGRLCFKIK